MYNLLSVLQEKSCGHLSGPTDRNESLLYDCCTCSGVWRDSYSTLLTQPFTQGQSMDGVCLWWHMAKLRACCCHAYMVLWAQSSYNTRLPPIAWFPHCLWRSKQLWVPQSQGNRFHNSLKEPRSWFLPSLNPWFQVRPQSQSIPWSQPGEILTESC